MPLFEVLDPSSPSDYLQRVEPSVSGGKKMATYFLDVIDKGVSQEGSPTDLKAGPRANGRGAGEHDEKYDALGGTEFRSSGTSSVLSESISEEERS